jgi:lipopolysaccharide transport system ATP-binding protein
MGTVLKVENVAKRYELGSINTRLLYEHIEQWWQKVRAKRRGATPEEGHSARELWALRDINFEVAQGEVLGLIGHNGSGKSTLLKIISQITAPTRGRVYLRGHVASLLEVGTGFHPELTGRENISLNGAILGMNRREIAASFDEIVEFSGVEKFIDTPVKRYSSGMRVRLAFAVAAHLQPEILIIDEVLAVGDAAFQQKCLGKMGEVASSGRTVIFVSHNMAAMQNLCSRALLLSGGALVEEGSPAEIVSAYLSEANRQRRAGGAGDAGHSGDQKLGHFVEWSVNDGGHQLVAGSDTRFHLEFVLSAAAENIYFGLVVRTSDGTIFWSANTRDLQPTGTSLPAGRHRLTFHVASFAAHAGVYWIEASILARQSVSDLWQAYPPLTITARRPSMIPPVWQGLTDHEYHVEISPLESSVPPATVS